MVTSSRSPVVSACVWLIASPLLAQAQQADPGPAPAAYSVDVLQFERTPGAPLAIPLVLDNQHVAHGNTARFSLGGFLVASLRQPADIYEYRSAIWPVPTAVSSSLTNPVGTAVKARFVLNSTMGTRAVSADGQWLALSNASDDPYRAQGGSIKALPVPRGARMELSDVNNQGVVVGARREPITERDTVPKPGAWLAGQWQDLPCGNCAYGRAQTVNNLGVVGGWVTTTGAQRLTLATRWEGGRVVWQGDPAVLGSAAEVVALNDAGQALVQSAQQASVVLPDGQTVVRLSPGATQVRVSDLNANGTVVGSVDGAATLWRPVPGNSGAWQAEALAAHLAARGVSTPAGWQWTHVESINQAGALLVRYRLAGDADYDVRMARLIPRP
ncbi:hypothetical protein EYS42_15180 [Aquabacterium lacunae]|uniref:Uncharacterized protein n=1 Tax=Aquabacterium lacunae TaxID=2528630 RepID=A0A4Q9GZC2_9BURK|nr:hypothetical protein [Aquabacterium lacunae]TBO28346.1 hypothetical protein EYS42_15180 [Aquabacterium lacunae]